MSPSHGTRRKILFFALIFLPVFIVCLWLYPRVQPAYQEAVVGTIDVGLRWLDPPMRIEVSEDGGWTTYTIEPDGTETFYWSRPGKNLTLFFLGLALLPALLVATPVSLRRRLVLLGVGMLLLYLLHVLTGFGLVVSVRCLINDPAALICKWLRTVGNTSGQVTAFLIWGLLTWQTWLPRKETEAAAELSATDKGLFARNPGFAVACVAAAGVLIVAYGNHFGNDFHFSDTGTLQDNLSIRSLGNTGKFFTDARTFSTRPEECAYRPVLTLSHAADHWASRTVGVRQFHRTQFMLLLAVGLLSALLFRRIYDVGRTEPENRYVALVAALLLCVHVVSTGTVNDFCARADLVAALSIVASFGIYLAWPARRRFLLYLLPMLAGTLAAPASLAFAPLLVIFAWFFEEDRSLRDLVRRGEWPRLAAVLRRCAPTLLVALAMGLFVRWMSAATLRSAGGVEWSRLLDQPYVWLHQARQFFLPFGLTADPGWSHPSTRPVLTAGVGLVFLVLLLLAIDRLSRVRSLRPAAFGLAWFVVGAVASSSLRATPDGAAVRPLFLAYAGLALAAIWLAARAMFRLRNRGGPAVRWIAAGLALALVVGSTVATRQRNPVWLDDETLWSDALQKSPDSPRSLLNYGRALTAKGRAGEALEYLERARSGLPDSPALELELGRATAALGRPEDAEPQFGRVLELDPGNGRARLAYAALLAGQGRGPEAVEQLEQAAAIGPNGAGVQHSLLNLYAASGDEEGLQAAIASTRKSLRTDSMATTYADGRIPIRVASETAKAYSALAGQRLDERRWIDAALILRHLVTFEPVSGRSLHQLGWARTQLGFHEGAEMAYRQALEIEPGSASLWNDLGWAQAQQGRLGAAIESFGQALQIDPSSSHARRNLAWVRRQAAGSAAEGPAE